MSERTASDHALLAELKRVDGELSDARAENEQLMQKVQQLKSQVTRLQADSTAELLKHRAAMAAKDAQLGKLRTALICSPLHWSGCAGYTCEEKACNCDWNELRDAALAGREVNRG